MPPCMRAHSALTAQSISLHTCSVAMATLGQEEAAAEQLCSLLGIDGQTATALINSAVEVIGGSGSTTALIEYGVSAHFARQAAAAALDDHSSSSATASPTTRKAARVPKKRPRSSPPKQQKTMGSYFTLPEGTSIKTQRTLSSVVREQQQQQQQQQAAVKDEVETDGDDIVEIISDGESKEKQAKKEEPDDEGTIKPPKDEESDGEDLLSPNATQQSTKKASNKHHLEPHILKITEVDYASEKFDAQSLANSYISNGIASPPFEHLSVALTAVSATTKRLEKERVLTNLLLSLLYFDRKKGIDYWDNDKLKSGELLFPDCSTLSAVLLCGNVASSGIVLGIGFTSISQALCSALSCSPTKLRQKASAAGEMGDAAADIFSGIDNNAGGSSGGAVQSRLTWGPPPKPLLITDVVNTIANLSQLAKGGGGKGIESKRKDVLYKLFSRCRKPEEIRFSVKIMCEHVRTGATLITLLKCLSIADSLYTDGFVNADWQQDSDSSKKSSIEKEALEGAVKEFRANYARHHHLKGCILYLVKYGLSEMSQRCSEEVFVPIQPMLAAPSRGVDEVMKHYRSSSHAEESSKSTNDAKDCVDIRITAEYKYDGQRAQIHYQYDEEKDDARVEIYSRHLDLMTGKFSNLASWIKTKLARDHSRKDKPLSFVIDAEIVAVKRGSKDDSDSRVLLPFQVLSTVKRSDTSSNSEAVEVCCFVFDILISDDQSLLNESLADRRSVLHDRLAGLYQPGYFEIAKSIDVTLRVGADKSDHTNDHSRHALAGKAELEAFLAEAIGPDGRCEGLMLKSLNSLYSSQDTREQSGGFGGWRKLKKDYVDDLADSIDVVPIGGWRGSGRKSKWFSPFLVAVYEPSTGEFQSLCRVMSGFSDEFYSEKHAFYTERILDEKPDNVSTGESPSYWFKPAEVWEIRGADLTLSPIHHAALGMIDGADGLLDLDEDNARGISLRFPRFVRTRNDKKIEEATSSHQIVSLFTGQAQRQH